MSSFGELNDHAVGVILKETVRRAINVIRGERILFDAQRKTGLDGGDDVVTSADKKGQGVYLRTLRECFPNAGIVAEEGELSIEPQNGCDIVFGVDPLDGTKAFARRQSHGVGTMIVMIKGGRIVAAYVGDVNTCEVYGFRPGSETVHRISDFEVSEHLNERPIERSLSDQYALLRDPYDEYGELARQFINCGVKSYQVDGGSIGIWLARLWKREVGAALLPPSLESPWDRLPIVGISHALGYVFLRDSGDGWRQWDPPIVFEPHERNEDMLIVHRDNLPEIPALRA